MSITEELFRKILENPEYQYLRSRIYRTYLAYTKEGTRVKLMDVDIPESILKEYGIGLTETSSANFQTSMIQYNFQTKESAHIFDNIQYVVDSNGDLQCPVEEAKVIKLFDKLFVGIPAKYLETVIIGGLNSDKTGYFHKGYNKVYFAIHDDILYLRKRN